jgi:hydroxyacylglutathione hydrolase
MDADVETIKLGMVNAYLVRAGDEFLLIDTGFPDAWEKLEAALKAAGCLPDRLRLVIITHGDFDHTGAGAKLQKQYGVKIAMHEADAAMAETGVPLKREVSRLGRLLVWFNTRGRQRPVFETFKPDVSLTDGQSLAEYGVDATVVYLPGHTPGSIAVLMSSGDIFIGDTLSNMFKPGMSPFVSDRAQLKSSIDRLKGMKLKTLYPGHGKPFGAEKLLKIAL